MFQCSSFPLHSENFKIKWEKQVWNWGNKKKSKLIQREQSCTVRREGAWYTVTPKQLSPEMGCSMALNVPLAENPFKPSAWNKADKSTLEKPLIWFYHVTSRDLSRPGPWFALLRLMPVGCTATQKLLHPAERELLLLQHGETPPLGWCLRAKC